MTANEPTSESRRPEGAARDAGAEPPASRPPTVPPTSPGDRRRRTGEPIPAAAKWSLALGILGLATAGLAAIFGLLLGLAALRRVPPAGRARGVAVAGVSVSAAAIPLGLLTAAMVVSGGIMMTESMRVAAGQARAARLRVDATALGGSVLRMAADPSVLPTVEVWDEAIRADGSGRSMRVIGPGSTALTLALNEALAGIPLGEVDDPQRTILLFEVRPDAPSAGGPALLPRTPAYREGFVFVFANGAVQMVRREDMDELRWEAGESD